MEIKHFIYIISLCLTLGNELTSSNVLHSLLICDICKEKIKHGEKYYSNYWMENYHIWHVNEFPSCYSCDRIISPNNCNTSVHKKGGTTLSDDRWICNICINKGELVYFKVDADDLLKSVIQKAKELEVIVPRIFDLQLVYDNELAFVRASVLRKGEKNPALMSISLKKSDFTNYVNISTECKVYVLAGLEKNFFISSLAHELMHVWIAVNIDYNLAPKFEEGLCNFFAHEILAELNSNPYQKYNQNKIESNADPIYGTGYQLIKKLSSELHTMKDLLNYIKYNSNEFGV